MISKERKFIISWCVDHKRPLYTFLIICSSLVYICSSATDSITIDKSIRDKKETLISAGEIFELGFFTPNESRSKARYVGIWYYNFTPKTVVWVANRDSPLTDRIGTFGITEDGRLHVLDADNKSHWSTQLKSTTSSNTTAKLMDSGNLVLISDDGSSSAENVWESFKNPTDTFLPGMEMTDSLNLTSWSSSNDPARGAFTFKKDEKGAYQIVSGKWPYWVNGETGGFISPEVDNFLSNISMYSMIINSGTLRTKITVETPYSDAEPVTGGTAKDPTVSPDQPAGCGRINPGQMYTPCPRIPNPNYTTPLSRLLMSFAGELQYLKWDDNKNWTLIWWAPRNRCGSLNACGNFGSCNINNTRVCKCIPGFEPSLPHDWMNNKDFSGGCAPKSQICSKNGKVDTFLNLTMMKVREPNTNIQATTETECKNECLQRCECKAYSFAAENMTAPCLIWQGDLSNLQEETLDGGRNFSVRVNLSDIDSTVRSCKICGTYIIPYPLSTGRQCGDPMYSNFLCNVSTGQVSFEAPNGTYRIIDIGPVKRAFVIQAKGALTCEAGNLTAKYLQLSQSSRFFEVNRPCSVGSGNSSSDRPMEGRDEVELSWKNPLEPTCNSSADCKDWPDSSCINVTKDGEKRCHCNATFQWDGFKLNCTIVELPSQRKKLLPPPIIAIIFISIFVLVALSCTTVYCLNSRRKRVAIRKGNQALHDLYDTERRAKYLIESEQFGEEDKKGINVPFFDLETILAATNNFSDANKLGTGGFGPVYKGKFPGGREIAVKRLSSGTGQGLKEFKNEVVLIAKLQHRNLIKLLGYCIIEEEKILLYEYMPNKSLDSFIFDRTRCMLLDWKLRFNIILGIARGLLYLHQDSRLTIIHRDLKLSNILLDEEMNPKISDFGLAKMFEGKQTQANTNKPSGTYGYMSPEYALNGFISVKSDVFSFGVVVLEIISGKKATGFYASEQTLNLPSYAWRLWNEDKAMDLIDQALRKTCNVNEFFKCLNVGLLRVQDDLNDRPTMSNVVGMLDTEGTKLPIPKQPVFVARRGTPNKSETCESNEITISEEEGR